MEGYRIEKELLNSIIYEIVVYNGSIGGGEFFLGSMFFICIDKI